MSARGTRVGIAAYRRGGDRPPAGGPPPAAAPAASTGIGSGRIALTFVLAAVLYSYLNPAIEFVKTYTATSAAKVQFHEALAENKRLHWQVQHSEDPVVLDEKARGQGLVGAGDTPIVVRRCHG